MIDFIDATTAPRASGSVKRMGLALAFGGMLAMAGGTAAYAAGPFAGMDGSWSGSGTVSFDSGTKERMSCHGAVPGQGQQQQSSADADLLEPQLRFQGPHLCRPRRRFVVGPLGRGEQQRQRHCRRQHTRQSRACAAERLGVLGDAESRHVRQPAVGDDHSWPQYRYRRPPGRHFDAQARLAKDFDGRYRMGRRHRRPV